MTRSKIKPSVAVVKELMSQSPDQLRELVRTLMQEILEAEMTEAVGAGKSERSTGRIGYRAG